jgi:uridine kinase
MDDVAVLCDKIEQQFKNHNKQRLFTVAISGIDASGKGYITKLIQDGLEARGHKVANINIDPWQNPLLVRLQKKNAAENFYNNVFRWEEFFNQLIIPLQQAKGIELQTSLIHTDADQYYSHAYCYENLDILLIEGIFLFQEKYVSCYDYKIWIECSFETGLKRAIKRNIEKLDEKRLVNDYHTYYYAAQHIHFQSDKPKQLADLVFNNESK